MAEIMLVDVTLRLGPCINSTHKPQNSTDDFSVKLSPCMCSHSSCPDWRNSCNLMAYVRPSYRTLPTYMSSSLGPHTSATALHTHVCMLVCLLTVIYTCHVHFMFSWGKATARYSVSMGETRSEDGSSWSMYGKLLLLCANTNHDRQGQAAHRGRNYAWCQWLKCLQVRAIHKTTLKIGKDVAHDFSVKLKPCLCSHSSCLKCNFSAYVIRI